MRCDANMLPLIASRNNSQRQSFALQQEFSNQAPGDQHQEDVFEMKIAYGLERV